MVRIFIVLASLATLLFLANLLLAFAIGDLGASSTAYSQARQDLAVREQQAQGTLGEVRAARRDLAAAGEQLADQRDRFWPHVWIGIVASLVSLLVNSISITYFIGTSRWCREVVEAYGMAGELAERGLGLKRRTFPWSFLAIVTTLAIAGTGAAADPYSSSAAPAAWVLWHFVGALLGTAVLVLAFFRQALALAANYDVIQEILAEAERIREMRLAPQDGLANPLVRESAGGD